MADAAAEEKVNIEHLLVEAMHNMPEDPLPSAEEIAWAKAAAATAHSTCSAAVAAQPVRGLGGAGLGLNRKGRSKAGNSSTISAATAPPALLLNPPGGRGAAPNSSSKLGRNRPGEPAAPAAAINSSASATTATRNASEAAVAAANAAATNATCGSADPSFSSGGVSTPTPDVSRSYNNNSKYAAGVRSFRTALSPDSEADGSSEWESASQDEIHAAAVPSAASTKATTGTSAVSWSSMFEDFVDPSTLAVCGVVLGACAGALLVLGASVWVKSRA